MVAPRAIVFRPLVKGNGGSGNEIVSDAVMFPSPSPLSLLKVPKHWGKTIIKHVTLSALRVKYSKCLPPGSFRSGQDCATCPYNTKGV